MFHCTLEKRMSKADQPTQGFVFVDDKKYPWTGSTITGAQLRTLATIPDNVEVYQKVPGKPDRLIELTTTVDLTAPGVEKFSTQAPGSQAG
jgi:hypothetical protein